MAEPFVVGFGLAERKLMFGRSSNEQMKELTAHINRHDELDGVMLAQGGNRIIFVL